ncbi:iron chelate uptake ABC transporter family permease subunit [Vibrio methylphosphonaticus]|uniref:iron chelate uptake ABC transporter family permease subunit n=1 Tax=Vibrio methylphosphonaticus TaxID=2946866 RepID=UPI002029C33C|nr:iron chelate uptake ABC transporter family permease subunit [Vibrio methylphosphonaticus]MCL9774152.1 iron chelate uptake ABC transporter family permease subunit [Vibrio methylphosphonaticus]
MRDSYKVTLLVAGCIAIIAWFIGQGLTADNYQFFLSRRTPKILAIVLAAVAISASSLVFQTITNNRILTPSILGFDSLYLMIQVLMVVILGSSSFWVIHAMSNFLLSTIIMVFFSLLLFHFYFKRQNNNVFTLLLIGIVCGSLFSSVTGFLTMLVDPNEFATIQNSMFASFNNINATLVYWSLIPLGLCLALLWYYAPKLDVLWLGVDNATSLGVNTKQLTQRMMMLITVMIAISTALVGPVLFFGLITVSLTREMFNKYQHRFLIVASSLLAIFLLVTGQWFVEKVLVFQTTISVIINLVGGSYFLFLLLRNRIN